MKARNVFYAILVLILLAGCAGPARTPAAQPITLTVMAAASLTDAFGEIGMQFEAEHPGVTVQFNFASSHQLAQQIIESAPADVFASANQKQMQVVVDAGKIAADAVTPFASNRLVVIYPKDNPAGLADLAGLSTDGLKLILAAKEVPVGQYSLDFLDKAAADPAFGADYKDVVLANVVSYEENVKSVLTKVSLGEADAGIVYTSDISSGAAEQVGNIDIPDALNVIAVYPIAAINDSAASEMAQAFVEYVASAEGQAVLAKYGFAPPTQ
jgi:molybdate transport system substrate-binding protein